MTPATPLVLSTSHPLLLILTSITFLPLTITALLVLSSVQRIRHTLSTRTSNPSQTHEQNGRKQVVVTGSPTTIIPFARLFQSAGYRIVIAEYTKAKFWRLQSAAWLSRSIAKVVFLGDKTVSSSALTVSHGDIVEFENGNIPASSMRGFDDNREVGDISNLLTVIEFLGATFYLPLEPLPPSSLVKARQYMEERNSCHILYPPSNATSLFVDPTKFMKFVTGLSEPGITTPETRLVKSRGELHSTLHSDLVGRKPGAKQREYTLCQWNSLSNRSRESVVEKDAKEGGVVPIWDMYRDRNNSVTQSTANGPGQDSAMITIPLESMNSTYQLIASLPISASSPWILRECIDGKAFNAHSLVYNSQLQVFTVTDDNDAFLPPSNPLHNAMRSFTEIFIAKISPQDSTHPGRDTESGIHHHQHRALGDLKCLSSTAPLLYFLSIHFLAESRSTQTGSSTCLYAIDCTPVPSTALAFYLLSHSIEPQRTESNGAEGSSASEISSTAMARNINETPSLTESSVTPKIKGVYSFPTSLSALVISPLVNLLLHPSMSNFVVLVQGVTDLFDRLFFYKEELFDCDDVWVWAWWWHVVVPFTSLLESWDWMKSQRSEKAGMPRIRRLQLRGLMTDFLAGFAAMDRRLGVTFRNFIGSDWKTIGRRR
ncbi:hypothetical protein M501DRAFT_53698 [Patellaria atrata CBS 101060]|uniref:Uncharacterized protein n=1 Tax=Patellaria atrata CBS 101060 TaxID=1346257 RepID=A0A9P4VTE1_9PEZI|nr:hypothetical protein M501DRAFT_53698 [Patellaria atrata CBS 101060]